MWYDVDMGRYRPAQGLAKRYRKKPTVIDAIPVADLLDAHASSVLSFGHLPQWVQENIRSGKINIDRARVTIATLEGTVVGTAAHMLIRGVENEVYPCERGIFEKTYEAVSCSEPRTRTTADPDAVEPAART